jgi:hypothetical protein
VFFETARSGPDDRLESLAGSLSDIAFCSVARCGKLCPCEVSTPTVKAQGRHDSARGFNPISANLMGKPFGGRMKFCPGGYGLICAGVPSDSIGSDESNTKYKATRHPSWRRCTSGFSYSRSDRALRDGSLGGRFPRHLVPGYDHAVPLGRNTFERRGFD